MKPTLLVLLTIGLFTFLIAIGESPSKAQIADITNAFQTERSANFTKLIESARTNGSVHVIVGINAPFVPEGDLDDGLQASQRREIKKQQADLLSRLPSTIKGVKRFDYIPYLALEADEQTLRLLEKDRGVIAIEEDVIGGPGLAESTVQVGAPNAWAMGYSGAGQTVAIVDSGVDKNHPFLSGRVVAESCYSSTTATTTSVCPGGANESTAPDSGLHCSVSVPGCPHGTHVAGIAAGRSATLNGVAKDANVVAIQIFSIFTGAPCSPDPTCARYFTSDLIRGLERVRTLKATIPSIAAVNLSLQTGQQFTTNCDSAHAATKAVVDNLRSLGVATVICSGNFAFTNALTAPACISSSISVGSVDDGSVGTTIDVVSNFSDSSPLLHLLGPGRWITSSTPNNNFEVYAGTSMATPHVTAAYAILRQRSPNASVGRILKALAVTGQPITDSRNGLVKPRINIGAALNAINRTTPADFDDDGLTDIAIFRPSVAQWWINRSSNGSTFAAQFGTGTDSIVPGDFSGDGRADMAVWRPSTGEWFVLRSEDFSYFSFPFGTNGDVAAPADYDGDGKFDATVYRPSTFTWFVRRSSDSGTTIQQFGAAGDLPVPSDYDGDGLADIAIFRPSLGQWWMNRTASGVLAVTFGNSSDKLVQGDYTGDGKSDNALWRPSTGEWFILRSENFSFYSFPFGAPADIPAPGDYDGDGKFDATVFRPSNSTWYSQRTTAGTLIQGFGTTGDRPVPNAYVP